MFQPYHPANYQGGEQKEPWWSLIPKSQSVLAKSYPFPPALTPTTVGCRHCPTEPQAQAEARERAHQALTWGRDNCRKFSQEGLQGPYLSIRTSSWAPRDRQTEKLLTK